MIRTSYSVEGLIRNIKYFVFLMNLSTEKCMASSSLRHILIIPLEPKTSGQLLGKALLKVLSSSPPSVIFIRFLQV